MFTWTGGNQLGRLESPASGPHDIIKSSCGLDNVTRRTGTERESHLRESEARTEEGSLHLRVL